MARRKFNYGKAYSRGKHKTTKRLAKFITVPRGGIRL